MVTHHSGHRVTSGSGKKGFDSKCGNDIFKC